MRLLIFASALVLAACMPQAPQPQQQQQSGAAATAPVASQSSKPSPDAAVATMPVIDREFMIGRWGDNGDCTKDIVINADGSFTTYSGGEGQWSLNGDTLRLEGKDGAYDLQLALINQNALRITNPDGSVGTSQRCS